MLDYCCNIEGQEELSDEPSSVYALVLLWYVHLHTLKIIIDVYVKKEWPKLQHYWPALQ